MNIEDTISALTVSLKGENKDAFEDALLEQLNSEIDNAENYLDETIRPRIEENWKYYRRELPVKIDGQAGFVDNTCQATVDHYTATSLDAFTSDDTLEIVPEGVSDLVTIKVINQVVNSVLDSENNRFNLYQSFFRDSFVSGASVFKPYVKEGIQIEKRYFEDVSAEELAIRLMTLESSGNWERVEQVITDEQEVSIERDMVAPASMLGNIAGDAIEVSVTATQVNYTGYFVLLNKEKTVKIKPVPAENFLINKDATSIDDARFIGDKEMVTISELLELGFDEDKVQEVSEKCGGDTDARDNEASRSRKRNILGDDNDITSTDLSQREVELYEVYIRSSVAETLGEKEKIAISKLYQVFYCEGVILDYQEVDNTPYSGASPIPVPHMFWGRGMVDDTKHIQTAKTGLYRQQFTYNEMASRPRFEFVPDQLVNPRDIHNTTPGAGIAVKSKGTITPITLGVLSGDNVQMASLMDTQREVGTGMSFTGQSMLGEVLKAGASTLSGQMIISEGQQVQKAVIQTLLENGIKPLIKTIYNMLRENFSAWEVTVDGQTFTVNPNDWPRLREIRVVTPLGKSARLEKAQTLTSLYSALTTAQPGTEAAKLATPDKLRNLLVEAYEYQDVKADSFLPSVEEISQKDQMMQMMQQMQGQLQQMQQQMEAMGSENQMLKVTASEIAQREIAIREGELELKRQKQEQDGIIAADKQSLAEDKQNADEEIAADKQELAEREQALREMLAEEDSLNAQVRIY